MSLNLENQADLVRIQLRSVLLNKVDFDHVLYSPIITEALMRNKSSEITVSAERLKWCF
jgi:hypothetical protein